MKNGKSMKRAKTERQTSSSIHKRCSTKSLGCANEPKKDSNLRNQNSQTKVKFQGGNTMKLTTKFIALAASAVMAFAAPAMAEDWAPDGPLTIQIGFGAGGSTDTMGRILGKVMADNTGWNIIVENKPGGGGVAMFTGLSQMPANSKTSAPKQTAQQPQPAHITANSKSATTKQTAQPVRKAKFTEIEKFGRKKNGARAGARHVSWESCQLPTHTRVGRSVGREDRPPQWGVVHEHTPVSIPVFMNTKIANSNFH